MTLRLWPLLISFIAFACDNVIVYRADKGCKEFERVTIDQLRSSPGRYHDKTIEVSGYYISPGEGSLLSNEPANETESISLTFDQDLISIDDDKQIKLSETPKIPSGSKMTIRGIVDMNDKGHLDNYALGIRVCYTRFSKKYRGLLFDLQESVFDELAKPK